MKHTKKVTAIILGIFLLAQLIGLGIVGHYLQPENPLPYGMEYTKLQDQTPSDSLISILLAFLVSLFLALLLVNINAKLVMKLWFLLITVLALGISFNAVFPKTPYTSLIALLVALPLALLKIYRGGFIIHNTTELLVYPGIAAVFVPLLNIPGMIVLLILISVYDAWAVWKSKLMQKMAKFQINELGVFGGFYFPYASKRQKQRIRKLKKEEKKLSKVKINLAILGGGDVIFSIVASGVVLKYWGLWPAILIIFGALLGLGYLLIFSEKKKFYPAMPFLTSGILIMTFLSYLVFIS